MVQRRLKPVGSTLKEEDESRLGSTVTALLLDFALVEQTEVRLLKMLVIRKKRSTKQK